MVIDHFCCLPTVSKITKEEEETFFYDKMNIEGAEIVTAFLLVVFACTAMVAMNRKVYICGRSDLV